MDYPFLLDKGSTDLFRFIVDSGDNDKISESLKALVKDRQSLEKQITECQSNITLLDNQILDLKEKTKNSELIINTCDKIIALQTKINKLRDLENIKEAINTCYIKEKELANNIDTINITLNPITELLKQSILDYKSYIENLKNKININKINNKILELKKSLNILSNLPKVEVTTIRYDSLLEIHDRLIKLQENIKIKSSFNLPEFNWTKSKYNYYDLLSIQGKLKLNYGLKISTLESSKSTINEDIDDINKVLKHIEICPLCGNKMNFKEVKL